MQKKKERSGVMVLKPSPTQLQFLSTPDLIARRAFAVCAIQFSSAAFLSQDHILTFYRPNCDLVVVSLRSSCSLTFSFLRVAAEPTDYLARAVPNFGGSTESAGLAHLPE